MVTMNGEPLSRISSGSSTAATSDREALAPAATRMTSTGLTGEGIRITYHAGAALTEADARPPGRARSPGNGGRRQWKFSVSISA
jgi:hypothetical protein